MDKENRLKKLRNSKGLTQEEFGKIIGVKKAAIQKYESGTVTNLKRSSIQKIAEFFNVSPSYVMGLDDNTTNSSQTKILMEVSEEEIAIIKAYREKNDIGKQEIERTALSKSFEQTS